jgi:hypothetical protein
VAALRALRLGSRLWRYSTGVGLAHFLAREPWYSILSFAVLDALSVPLSADVVWAKASVAWAAPSASWSSDVLMRLVMSSHALR